MRQIKRKVIISGMVKMVMMLFIVGLELEPRMLWAMRTKLLGLGGLQVFVTGALVTAIGLFAGLAWQIAVAIGMVLALSSTAIVLQTLNERGLIKSEGGRASFSVLLFQDIVVIPMLAVIPLLALPELALETGSVAGDHGGGHGPSFVESLAGWQQALVTIAAIAFVIVADDRRGHSATDDAGRALAGAGYVPGRSGPRHQRISPRAREQYRALQGPAPRALLHHRRRRDQFLAAVRQSWSYPRDDPGPDAAEGGRALRTGGLVQARGFRPLAFHARSRASRRVRFRSSHVYRCQRRYSEGHLGSAAARRCDFHVADAPPVPALRQGYCTPFHQQAATRSGHDR